MNECKHTRAIKTVTPGTRGCAECLKTGSTWFHLRVCRICGHVGCCDQSPGRHATKHFHATQHPIIEGYDPPEGWGWCFVDEIMIELSDTTEQGRPDPALLLTAAPACRAIAAILEDAQGRRHVGDAEIVETVALMIEHHEIVARRVGIRSRGCPWRGCATCPCPCR